MRNIEPAKSRLRPFDAISSDVPMLNASEFLGVQAQERIDAAWARDHIGHDEALRLVRRHQLLLSSTSVVTTFSYYERVARETACREIEAILESTAPKCSVRLLPDNRAALLSDIAKNYD